MSDEQVKAFAISNGYVDIKELGNLNQYKVFIPIPKNNNRIIGYPKYILVHNDDISIKVDTSMEISKNFFPDD